MSNIIWIIVIGFIAGAGFADQYARTREDVSGGSQAVTR